MSITLNSSDFLNNLAEIEQRVLQGTRLYAETSSQKLVAYAKENRPWHDVTALSRQTISAEVQSSGANQKIILKGGTTSHFIYLETAREGKYAIIKPTMIKLSPGIIVGWRRVISNL